MMIKINNVNKYYNRGKKSQIHVIDNTTLSLPESGLVAILGPSGCGKTTLLNAIGGLDKINKGSIYIDDKKITSRCVYKKDKIRNLKIGYIFQDYKLIDNMTVYDSVSMVLRMIGIKDKKEVKKRVDYILERLGMYRYRYRPCGMLSGGERQRVGIARALVKNPDIILADEPTGNLDSKNTIEIMNIIKSISKDKLVVLVTHEVNLAKFYADRIIEVLDGKVEKDYENKNDDGLDYRIDNKFYLKDFKYHETNHDNNINVDTYSDTKEKLNLVIVFKNGNIYIKNKDNDKIEIVDSTSNIEFINDNYQKLDKSIYEKYSFDFDKIINNNIKLRYTSIFNIFTIFSNGFKKVFGYSFVKKLLLIGFFLSSLFVTYAVSKLLGVNTIEDKYFITSNKNYLKIEKSKTSVADYLKYEELDSVNYLIPGTSEVTMQIDTALYYQTEWQELTITGSLAGLSMISKDDLIYGRMPQEPNEIVIDKMVYNNATGLNMLGIYDVSKMIDVKVFTKNKILTYYVVGVVNLESPSIYSKESEFINIISNNTNEVSNINDFNLYRNKVTITKGREPSNDYEVLVNSSLGDTYKLEKETDDVKINGNKLRVVGYYTSEDNINYYFVNSNMIKYRLIESNTTLTIYPKDKDKAINDFRSLDRVALDTYIVDKNNYLEKNKNSMNSSIITALIILGISLIEIILMTRSSFLSRIKEVGIYRAIGVKKSDIYKMFMGEAFAITTLAQIPGVLFMSYCISVISDISYVSKNYIINIYVVLFCIILLYLFNIIIGLIPVFNTIRKTPAEILARHDLE